MAKTDQELAQEEINNRQYMYGGLGPFSQFLSGERREIIRPESTEVVGFGAGPTGVEYITETIPAEYGPVEYDPSYSPVRRSLSALGDILYEAPSFFGLRGPDEQIEAMQGVGSSLRDALFGSAEYMSEQARAAASGGEYFDPETGRTVAFDPTITMFGGNPAEGAVMGSGFRMGRRAAEAAESKGFDTENIFLHGTSDRIDQPRSSATQSRDSGFIGRGFYGATEPRISDFYANSAPARFRDEAGSFSDPNVFPYVTRRGNYKQYSLAEKQDLARRVREDEFLSQEITQKNIDDGFIGAEVVDADGNIIERVNYFPEEDTRSAFLDADLYSGGRTGTGIAAASAGSAIAERMPPLSNAQRTQLGASTLPSYQKARNVLGEGRTLDFGAGRGQGAAEIGADTFEPYPREGFNPTYSSAADIPDESYENLTSLNVLNVMPRDVRDQAVADIGRVLAPGGRAVVTTRGRDVLNAKGTPGREPMSIITTADTYQKGFTQPELRDYMQAQLGEGFTISNLPEKIGQAGVLIEKTSSPTALYSGGRTGTGIATASALRNELERQFGGPIPEVNRDTELLMRVGDPRSVNEMVVEMTDPLVSSAPIIGAEDLIDRPFITGMSDTSRSGLETVTSVNGVPLNAVMRGGKYFGLQPQNLERGIAFASAPGAVMGQLNRAAAAQALGGRPVAFIPFGMRPASPDFATMSTDIMVPYAQQVMSRSDKIALDRRIREGTGSKTDDKKPIPDWVGIDNATPEYLQGLGGDRKSVTKALDEFRDAGSLSRSQARAIVTDPTQFDPVFGDIDMIYELDPQAVADRRFLDSDHPSYESALLGRPLGALRDTEKVNIFEFNPLAGTQEKGFYNFRQKQLDAGRDFPIGGSLSSPTMKAFLPGGHGIITQEMVDDLIRRGLIRP